MRLGVAGSTAAVCTGWHPAAQVCHRGAHRLQIGSGSKAQGADIRPYTTAERSLSLLRYGGMITSGR